MSIQVTGKREYINFGDKFLVMIIFVVSMVDKFKARLHEEINFNRMYMKNVTFYLMFQNAFSFNILVSHINHWNGQKILFI